VFDKTGTLTQGKPDVTDEIECNDCPVNLRDLDGNSFVLQLAASVEKNSEHPIGQAIVRYAEERGLYLMEVDNFMVVPGRGVRCSIEGSLVTVGSFEWVIENGGKNESEVRNELWKLESLGRTSVCVCVDDVVVGLLGVSDKSKPEAYSTVSTLQSLGLDVWMLTGDNATTAESIANEVGISSNRIRAGVLPGDKAEFIEGLRKDGHVVCMVGDGINDSPSLARSDVGLALGAGTEIAVEAADMVLVRSNLFDVVVALDLSRKVFRRIQWNFLWALIYNIVMIPFAAGVFYPFIQLRIHPAWAGLLFFSQ